MSNVCAAADACRRRERLRRTSVLIDSLCDHPGAVALLEERRRDGRLHASEITRLEILAGMRTSEEEATRSLFEALVWHPVDADVAEEAGQLGRRWLPSHHTLDSADLAIAATALRLGVPLLTMNVQHFPMFAGLRPPY